MKGEFIVRRPTFSILVNSEENTNLALKELIEISLEEGIITEQDLQEIEKKKEVKYTT